MKKATLVFLLDHNKILLAMKKRGFGEGKWNGVGGKPEGKETIVKTASRECFEEIGVRPLEMTEVATLDFVFLPARQEWNQQVIVYLCRSWEGNPIETEEMAPKWFDLDKIPYEQMWSDDKYWLPKVLEGEYVQASFTFDYNDNLVDYSFKD